MSGNTHRDHSRKKEIEETFDKTQRMLGEFKGNENASAQVCF